MIATRIIGTLLIILAGFYLLQFFDDISNAEWWLKLMLLSGLLGLFSTSVGIIRLRSKPCFRLEWLNAGTVFFWGFYWRPIRYVVAESLRGRDLWYFNDWNSGNVFELGPCYLLIAVTLLTAILDFSSWRITANSAKTLLQL